MTEGWAFEGQPAAFSGGTVTLVNGTSFGLVVAEALACGTPGAAPRFRAGSGGTRRNRVPASQ